MSRKCLTPGATYRFEARNHYPGSTGWTLSMAVSFPDGTLAGLNNDIVSGARSTHDLYRDIVHDAMEQAAAEVRRLNALYCERTDRLPYDDAAGRDAAVAKIAAMRRRAP